MTCFIAIVTLLQWSGTEPAVSLRCAYYLFSCQHITQKYLLSTYYVLKNALSQRLKGQEKEGGGGRGKEGRERE